MRLIENIPNRISAFPVDSSCVLSHNSRLLLTFRASTAYVSTAVRVTFIREDTHIPRGIVSSSSLSVLDQTTETQVCSWLQDRNDCRSNEEESQAEVRESSL
nr:hypothetical protein CFP56_62908 [Quercus suber]